MRPFSFFLIAGSLVAGVAQADPAADAKDLFERGRQLRAVGKCAEAAPLFEKAAAIYPAGLGNVRNAAECEEKLGHFATARRLWLDLKRSVMIAPDAKYAGWQSDAEAAAARLAPKVARLTVQVTITDGQATAPATQDSKVQVRLNGELVAPELIGTQLDRDPGKYVVSVEGDRQPASEQSVDLAAGDAKQLTFEVHAPPAPAAPRDGGEPSAAPAPTPVVSAPSPDVLRDDRGAEAPPSSAAASRRTAGWIGVGVGAAALVGAGISVGVRQAALGDLQAACPSYATEACPARVQSTVSRGATASTLVNVLGVAGGVFVATGILLVVLSPSPTSSAHASNVPEIAVGLGAFSARWSFQ